MLVSAGPTGAQTVPTVVAGPRYVPPEAMIIPFNADGQSVAGDGWLLLYHNEQLGSQAPNIVIDSRRVTLRVDKESKPDGVITWKIVRTRNDSCVSATVQSCPDKIEILSVPDGFRAFPESAWVDEGHGIQIYIVRAGIG